MLTILVSVYEKTGLLDLLNRLKQLDQLKIIATTSTCKFLKEQNFSATAVEELTKFPEILSGRVKTLHPQVFGGILARSSEEDMEQLEKFAIPKIDLVIVNLYPFEKKLKENLNQEEMVEFIDIGGVSLIRAAAKNFDRVAVVTSPDQYEDLAQSFENGKGIISKAARLALAQEAFEHTAVYDRAIADYLLYQQQYSNGSVAKDGALPAFVKINLAQHQILRYGENPHQAAVWYGAGKTDGEDVESFPPFKQLQGKELSANNITDTYCLVKILREIGSPAACIIKHNNPCGVAVGPNIEDAFDKAYKTDPTSAFGGIYGFTDTVSKKLAERIIEGFVEIVVAPSFSAEALDVFKSKKNIRVLELRPRVLTPGNHGAFHLRDLEDFGWIMETDTEQPVKPDQFQCVSGKFDQPGHINDAAFAWGVVKHLTSNAIFVAKNGVSLGFGIGQTSRIASVEIALAQAGEQAKGAVLASDAFFPATDNIESAAKAGISVIVQPGGSIKDKEVIAACEKAGITMLFTGQRCFKH
jgi:phosphoribosylaminoimidazolecarboxamide formyltransferase/IMP cyclohydrolase